MKERPILFSGPMVRAILDGRKTVTRRVVKHDINRLAENWEWNNFKAHPNMPDFETWGPKQGCVLVELDYGTVCGVPCPYGGPGGRLYVREAWRFHEDVITGMDYVEYKAGGMMPFPTDPDLKWTGNPFDGRWRPSIHMYRWMSRLTLEITDIRVERLQDITEEDAIKEGAAWIDAGCGHRGLHRPGWSMLHPLRRSFHVRHVRRLLLACAPSPQLHGSASVPHPAQWKQCLGSAKAAFGNYINTLHGGKNWNLKPTNLWDLNPWVWVVEFKVDAIR